MGTASNDRFAKPLYWLIPVPRVRIPPSPPCYSGITQLAVSPAFDSRLEALIWRTKWRTIRSFFQRNSLHSKVSQVCGGLKISPSRLTSSAFSLVLNALARLHSVHARSCEVKLRGISTQFGTQLVRFIFAALTTAERSPLRCGHATIRRLRRTLLAHKIETRDTDSPITRLTDSQSIALCRLPASPGEFLHTIGTLGLYQNRSLPVRPGTFSCISHKPVFG
jgi:hypothetical protein